MSGRTPEERVRLPVLHQRWRRVLFLHWRFPADTVAALLPEGLRPDVYDDSAWVSVTPFGVEGARMPFAPPVPGWSSFPETNVRTYVRGPGGLDGLWFFTLEVGSTPTALGGRLAVPYRRADMSITTNEDSTVYVSRRRSDHSIGHPDPSATAGPDRASGSGRPFGTASTPVTAARAAHARSMRR